MEDIIAKLREHGIGLTPQRIAVAQVVLRDRSHWSADEVWQLVQQRLPTVSRATVYNNLNLFVAKHLLKEQILQGGHVVFDSCVEPHHHFLDEQTGQIHDVPWEAVRVETHDALGDFEVRDYQVIMRGRRRNH
ncbi:MAG: transcriptional repressor [Sedimentisphaerales bacterium]|nr:transcriptional repressor [Sedimentisphaerales bacterium]